MGIFAASATHPSQTGAVPSRIPSGPELCCARFATALATGDLDDNDLGPVGILPANCLPVMLLVDGTDMDSSTAALVFQFGLGNLALQDAAGAVSADLKSTLISTHARDGGAAWGLTAVTPGAGAGNTTSGAFQQMLLSHPMMSVQAVNYDRVLMAKVTEPPTTAVAGTLGVTLLYRAV